MKQRHFNTFDSMFFEYARVGWLGHTQRHAYLAG
jgi:hypothetical protein